MDANPNEKFSNKDLNQSEEIPFIQKIFMFFYNTLQMKGMNKFFYCLFISLEAIQLNSYVFDTKHHNTWGLNSTAIEYLNVIVGALRVSPLMKYVSFKVYVIIWAIVLVFIFANCLLVIMVIQFNKVHSKFYYVVTQTTRVYADILIIFLFLPLAEVIALMLHCEEGRIALITDGVACFTGYHYLYATLSVLFLLCLTCLVLFLNSFMFYPFNHEKETLKIDSTADIIMCLFKLMAVLQLVLIEEEWASMGILFIIAAFNIKLSNENPSFCCYILQCFIFIKNTTFCWAYIVLMLSKIAKGTQFANNLIYLLAWGYPLIILVTVLRYKKQFSDYTLSMSTCTIANDFIFKLKGLIKLVDSFLDSKGNKSNKESKENKQEIILRGYVMIHIQTCIFKECPLEKFIEPGTTFAMQKTCLLHHVNNVFLNGVKNFQESRMITMFYIAFNFEKKYNLNAVKTHLGKLEKGSNTIIEEYILFYIKQCYNINNKGNAVIHKSKDDEDIEAEDLTKENFARLKYLIEASTKLYGEFWGILSTHMTANLNLHKLFGVGNKLNIFLKEINRLWENELKMKRIDVDNQGIIQLYSYFLREIMRNKKKADEINKKINEKQNNESKKPNNDNWETSNLYSILENQDYIIFARSNEKGECQIFQCSNSIVHLLGYLKQDFIGKSIEIMIPSIFSSVHSKMLSQRVKNNQSKTGTNGVMQSNDNKKQIFILPKTKVGYLLALNARFTIYNDDDFSHTYIIKSKFEFRDTKSNYSYYILANDEFAVDSISSSALNLGLSLDLLKKYVVSLNILIRDESNLKELDFDNVYKEYEEEPKKVTWVFPNIIYPKNDSQRQKDEDIMKLIQQSQTKVFYLQITLIKCFKDDIVGYCFKFTEIENITTTKKLWNESKEIKPSEAKLLLFDLLRLNYIRTELVSDRDKQNGNDDYFQFNPIPLEQEKNIELIDKSSIPKRRSKLKSNNDTNIKSSDGNDNDENDDESKEEQRNNNQVNMLTKDKLAEYQSKSIPEIKQFIFSLPFFGEDIFIERHRSNKERYSVGKITEPYIKIIVSEFLKRMGQKIASNNNKKYTQKIDNSISSIKTPTTNISSSNYQEQSYLQGRLSTNSSAYLSNIFNYKSVTYIQILSFVVFLLITALMSTEFGLSYNLIRTSKDRVGYVNKAHQITTAMMYTKFYITEIIKAQNDSYAHLDGKTQKEYIQTMMVEMNDYRKIIFDNFASFQNASVDFGQKYYAYTANTTAYVRTLMNAKPAVEYHSFTSMMTRIPTNIFYVSTVTDNYKLITMENRNAYELMTNLLNDYFLLWAQLTFLITDDTQSRTGPSSASLLIYGFSFLISILSLGWLWFLILIFIRDREKPVNLFLTIKKAQFIDLKTSSEIFLNKLLNKFFGNEEAEDESIVEYSPQSKTDIIISAFKQKTETKCASKITSEYLVNYMILVAFFIVFEAYMSFKYFYINETMKNINRYTEVLNATHYGESDMVLSVNVFKSYFFDSTIPIFNKSDTDEIYQTKFTTLSVGYGVFILKTYNTSSFLEAEYIEQFYQALNKDISSLVIEENNNSLQPYLGDGFNLMAAQYFESLRYLILHYAQFKNKEFIMNSIIGSQINYIVRYIIKPWFVSLFKMLNKAFESYCDEVKLIEITVFIILLVISILLYSIVWKAYEERLKTILKTSVDLINLIPEEIKDSIVECLNKEEDEKKDA